VVTSVLCCFGAGWRERVASSGEGEAPGQAEVPTRRDAGPRYHRNGAAECPKGSGVASGKIDASYRATSTLQGAW